MRLSLLGGCLLAVAGCLGDAAPDVVAQPVTAGRATDADPAVVALLDGEGRAFCSGAVISDHEVLTAAHCLESSGRKATWVFAGSDPAGAGAKVRIVGASSDWRYDGDSLKHDVAILFLEERAGVPPLPVLSRPLVQSDVGSAVRVVGFGSTFFGDRELRKRSGSARIDALAEDAFRLRPGPSQPCGGDSGGPLLLVVDGVEQVAGVVSRGDLLCASHAWAIPVDPARVVSLARGDVQGGCQLSGPGSAPTTLFPVVLAIGPWLFKRRK